MNLLFNIKDLKQVLYDYHNITNMRIAIFDDEFHEIASYPNRFSQYCQIIRTNDTMNAKCISCDHNAFLACQKKRSLHIYQCHAGLTEAIVPIFANEIIIGYVMLGQVLCTDNEKKLWDSILNKIDEDIVDVKALEKAFNKKDHVSYDKIISSSHMMEICALYLYNSQKLILKEDSLPSKIDKFIGKNLTRPLTVKLICKAFDIGKTKLYEISNQSYGMGIARHITQIRIQRAKVLLTDTNLTIYQIASKVGIPDYNYFTKVFKKEVGTPPKTFRQENTYFSHQ